MGTLDTSSSKLKSIITVGVVVKQKQKIEIQIYISYVKLLLVRTPKNNYFSACSNS